MGLLDEVEAEEALPETGPEADPVEAAAPSIFDDSPEPEPEYDAEMPIEEPLELSDDMIVEDNDDQYLDEREPGPVFGQQEEDFHQDHSAGLVSDPVADASGASLAQLAQAVASQRALQLGNHEMTLEQLVSEICTPILKQWLDTNLPYMVERIVKQEIERIVSRSERM